MKTPLQYRCDPLSAWISVAQCKRNAKLGVKAKTAKAGTDAAIAGLRIKDTCPECPGVVVIASRDRIEPRRATTTQKPAGGGEAQAAGCRLRGVRQRRKITLSSNREVRRKAVGDDLFNQKALRSANVKRALRVMGISLTTFAEEYAKNSNRRNIAALPSAAEIAAVEAFQKTGDIATLRKKLKCSPSKAYATVTGVTAHQARTTKGETA